VTGWPARLRRWPARLRWSPRPGSWPAGAWRSALGWWPGAGGPRTPPPGEPLLSEAFLRQLERLSLASLAAVMSGLEGEHAGIRRAGFAELDGHRGYQPGDDPRLIDWNAYARLDELYVRAAPARHGMTLCLLVDRSRSMAGGKLRHAQRTAAALGAVALLHGDTVRVYGLGDGTAWPSPAFTGRPALGPLLRCLETLPAAGRTDLPGSVQACGHWPAGPVAVVLISDLLVPAVQDVALDWLGPAATVLHLADPADTSPPLGSLDLRDRETGETVRVTVTPALAARYRDLYRARAGELARRAVAGGVRYIPVDVTAPVADLVFEMLPGRGGGGHGWGRGPRVGAGAGGHGWALAGCPRAGGWGP
jgi:uncharacterized protein (DUF58 family)